MAHSKNYITDLKRVIGVGPNNAGLHHWKWQRISAIALVFLYSWFIYSLFMFFDDPEYVINDVLYSPFYTLLFMILISTSLYHGVLGFKVICEDYIHNHFLRNAVIISSYFVTFVTVIFVVFTLTLNFIVNL